MGELSQTARELIPLRPKRAACVSRRGEIAQNRRDTPSIALAEAERMQHCRAVCRQPSSENFETRPEFCWHLVRRATEWREFRVLTEAKEESRPRCDATRVASRRRSLKLLRHRQSELRALHHSRTAIDPKTMFSVTISVVKASFNKLLRY